MLSPLRPSPQVPSVGPAASERDGESEKGTAERDEKEGTRRARKSESEQVSEGERKGGELEREALAGAHRERYIFPGRVAVAKSSQESRTNRRP